MISRLWGAAALALLPWCSLAQAGPPAGADLPFRGRFFEVRYPADFSARAVGASKAAEADAAIFSSPDGSVSFYVYSPQWAGQAPGIALDETTERLVERRDGPGKSSGVEGTYTWTTIASKDGRYSRSYQAFRAKDDSLHWVIGLQYRTEADRARHQARYVAFKASLKQFAD